MSPKLNQVGCFARCKTCGKAIRLYETAGIIDTPGEPARDKRLVWVHFATDDDQHPAVLNPGVCDDKPDAAESDLIGAVRAQLVALDDVARRNMLDSEPGASRYYAGRSDALRDALSVLAILEVR